MSETWTPTPAGEVEPGTTVRLHDGRELLVSRVEQDFMGMPGWVAFIEDTPRQWFKAPIAGDALIDVQATI